MSGCSLTCNLALANLCIEFCGGNEAVSEHLTDGFYRQTVLQTDGRGKGMSCRVRGSFGMRWESCLDDDIPYLAVEMAIRGELTKEQTLLRPSLTMVSISSAMGNKGTMLLF